LYAAFLGLVSQPQPFGAFSPKEFLTARFIEVRAAIRLVMEGVLNPNLITP